MSLIPGGRSFGNGGRFAPDVFLVCQQKIDFEKELIKLSSTEPTEVTDLPRRIAKDCARYHFFLYKHSHEGDYLESTGE